MKIVPNLLVRASVLLASVFFSSGGYAAAPAIPRIESPAARVAVDVRVGAQIAYDVLVDERAVLKDATLSLTLDSGPLGKNAKLKNATTRSHDATITP
ncbi:MAG TPA: glycoside hydrolase family 97 N-terminal domain-containing protein, partial [Opitutus sp.]|nr:glycoside hydrolase family 97 N-terminal domain-containing protein [Opitutus sp.]